MQRIRTLIVNHLWWMVLVVAVTMLALHGFGIHQFVVDSTSLSLLLLVLVSPFIAAIKKVKIGEFEAEIDSSEVNRVARQAEKAVSDPPVGEIPDPSTRAIGAAIRSLAEVDPIVALAKLRIELETRLRRLYRQANSNSSSSTSPMPLARTIRDLSALGVIDSRLSSALRDVVAICNRAIHGEEIREVDARQITEVGIDLVEDLDRRIREHASTNPVEESVITPSQRDEYQEARYRLTTVVPLVDQPRRNSYLLTQEELDAFFDGYSEFAEFAVSLERLP